MSDNGSREKQNLDPWGRPKNDGPPDLISVLKNFLKKWSKSTQKNSDQNKAEIKYYITIGAVLLVILWALSGIFLVSPSEESVILRFGKYVVTLGPGPHWIPRLIDSKTTLNVQQVDNFSYQAEMLTKDENIVSVALAVQYRIANPKKYLFNVVDPVTTLHQATSSTLRQVVGQMALDTVLTTGRQQLRDAVALELKQALALYQTGLEVTDVTLLPAKPPEAVTQAFDDAIKAREDEQRYINQAEAYARRVVSISKGRVARLQQSASAYKKEVVFRAKGQTARYLALLKPYKEAPEVTRERLYLDALSGVLARTSNIIVDSKGGNVLYLPLDQLLRHQIKTESQSANNHTANEETMTKVSKVDSFQVNNSFASYNRPTYPTKGRY